MYFISVKNVLQFKINGIYIIFYKEFYFMILIFLLTLIFIFLV